MGAVRQSECSVRLDPPERLRIQFKVDIGEADSLQPLLPFLIRQGSLKIQIPQCSLSAADRTPDARANSLLIARLRNSSSELIAARPHLRCHREYGFVFQGTIAIIAQGGLIHKESH